MVTVSLTDTFTDTDGTLITNHAPELGGAWLRHPAHQGQGTITANHVYVSTAGVVMNAVDTPGPDMVVETHYRFKTSAGNLAIVGRLDPTALTFYMARLSSANNWELHKCITGTFTLLDSAAGSMVADQVAVLRLELVGNSQKVYVDDVLILEANDTTVPTGTRIGFRDPSAVTSTTGKHLDRLTVREAVGTPVTAFVYDTFTDTDGTALSAHAPELGGTWVRHPDNMGEGTITANRLYASVGGPLYNDAVNPGADMVVEAGYQLFDLARAMSVIGRVAPDTLTYYRVCLEGTDTWKLYRGLNGVETQLASATLALLPKQIAWLRVELVAATQRVYLDGLLLMEAADAAISGGYAGVLDALGTSATTGKHLRELIAWNPAPPAPPAVWGSGGGIDVWFETWRATVDNVLVEEISDVVAGGQVSLNHDRAIKTEGFIELRDARRLTPYTDYVAIFMHQAYHDGRVPRRDQLGLFAVRVPPGVRTVERAEGTFPLHDLTSVLARHAFTDAYNVTAGTNYVTAVLSLLSLAGITRHAITATAQTLATDISFAAGTTYLAAANTLLEAIGSYHLAVLPDGRMTSHPSEDIRYTDPYRTIGSGDLMAPVQTQPTDTTVANVVTVVQDNPNAAPLTATRRNDEADSPTSTVNLGVQHRVERRSDLATQAAVDALAERLLAEGRTWYQTVQAKLLPDPAILVPHQTVDWTGTGELVIFNGRWWVRTATIGFTPGGAGPVVELNRVTDTLLGAIL